MEKRLAAKPSLFTARGHGHLSDSSLEAVVEKLHRDKVLCLNCYVDCMLIILLLTIMPQDSNTLHLHV